MNYEDLLALYQEQSRTSHWIVQTLKLVRYEVNSKQLAIALIRKEKYHTPITYKFRHALLDMILQELEEVQS